MSATKTRMETLARKSLSVRAARAVIKGELRACLDKHAALRMAAQHIADPAPELAGMTAYDLIACGRGCGPAVAVGILGGLRIGAHTKIGQRGGDPERSVLTERQREDLAAALADPSARTRTGWHTGRTAPASAPKAAPAVVKPVVAVKPVMTPEPETAGPSLAHWCPRCGDYAIALRDGTCGWCYTKIVGAA